MIRWSRSKHGPPMPYRRFNNRVLDAEADKLTTFYGPRLMRLVADIDLVSGRAFFHVYILPRRWYWLGCLALKIFGGAASDLVIFAAKRQRRHIHTLPYPLEAKN